MKIKELLSEYLLKYKNGYNNTGAVRWLYRNDSILWERVLRETSFLPATAAPKQRVWHILNDSNERVLLLNSTEEATWQGSYYRMYKGVGSQMKDPACKERAKQTCIEKYGVDNPAKVNAFREKQKQTNLEKYGHTNFFASDQGIQIVKDSWADPTQRKIRTDNIEKSMMERYGVKNAMQDASIQDKAMKAGFRYKEYILPSGNIIKIQGFENFALDELLLSYDEAELMVGIKNVPRIQYTLNGITHYYFPDIYIPKENKIIEVKSTYTYMATLTKNKAKEEACIKQGYLFEFKIYNRR